MCTIGYHHDLKILFKNRDKQSVLDEEIIENENFIACRTCSADYFSWGLNKYGCAFVSAAINSPEWTRLVYQGLDNEARDKYNEEHRGLHNPMELVSEKLPGVRTIEEWAAELESSNRRWMGYNVILADTSKAFLIEFYGNEKHTSLLTSRSTVTNHFRNLAFGPRQAEDYPSSFRRYEYGNDLIKKAESIDDIFEIVNPTNVEQRTKIWRNGKFITLSSSVIDFQQGEVHYLKHTAKKYARLSCGRNEK